MPDEFDIIVLGCGTMGAAACSTLCQPGASARPNRAGRDPLRVLALDQFNPPHDQGSHHGHVRMFRMSYYEDPAYVPWLRRSLTSWSALARDAGRPIISLAGALYMGHPDSPLIAGSRRSIRENGLEHELLDHSQLRERYPMFRLPPDFVGILDVSAGFIYCEEAVAAMIQRAKKPAPDSTFILRSNEAALSWRADDAGVEVRTSASSYRARGLIITAGPWAGQVLSDLSLPLTVTRQVQGWLRPLDPEPYARLPCWGIDIGHGALFYGFPSLPRPDAGFDDGHWIKLARHAPGEATAPGAAARSVRPEDSEDFMPLVREFLPGLAGAPCRTATCLYTNSPDSHFIIDRHPRHANVAFACGFSGHGFKLAPAVGHILSELVATPPPHHPEPLFALGRFAP